MRSEVQVLLDPPLFLFAQQAAGGALAQLGERLICIQEVRSSILLGSTKVRRDLTVKHWLQFLTVQSGRIDIVQRDTIQHCLIARSNGTISVRFRPVAEGR